MSYPENSGFCKSHDGLNLYYRDFGTDNPGTPVICLPGLTRNSRDFDDLATRLSARRRIVTTDFRGRGFSDHDPNWQNYHPLTYVQDVWSLLDHLEIERTVVIGTSLGGLCAMVMSATRSDRFAGAVMNDIGPEINPAGIERISNYTGRVEPVGSWTEAVEQIKSLYGDWLPGLEDSDWEKMARRAYREDDNGVPRLDMDANIGEAVRKVGAQKGDPWALFDSLGDKPITLIWGVLSDILTEDIIEKMKARKSDLTVVPVPNRGHVPLLDEPECTAAIDELLERAP